MKKTNLKDIEEDYIDDLEEAFDEIDSFAFDDSFAHDYSPAFFRELATNHY